MNCMGMRIRNAVAGGTVLLLLSPVATFAQSAEILAVVPTGTGARPLAMGEAYHAIGGDIHSLYYNPAGLGLVKGLGIEGGISHRSTILDTRYFGTESSSKVFSTGLDNLGLVYSIPTERGSLVFALGAHRLRDLDNRYRLEGYNTSDDPDLGETWVEASDSDRGALYGYAAGVAVEVSRGTFIGFSLEAISGSNSYTYLLDAYDTDNVWTPYDGHRWDDGTDYSYQSNGLRMAVGTLWMPVRGLSFGGTIRMPTDIEITEEWYQSETLYYDDATSEVTYDDDGIYSYSLRIPFEFDMGAALSIAGVTMSGSASFTDYSQAWYSKSPYDGFNPDFFVNNYEPQWKLGSGMELAVPGGMAVRAGYQWSPLIFQAVGEEIVRNREIYSAGIGMPMGDLIHLDLTYRSAQWETGLGATSEVWRHGQFIMSFGYRF
ncbi:hypothetical protein ACFL3H_10580 [Gemmatimonadota bacterium]